MRSHAVGVGEPLSMAETRAMMLLRANSLSKGHSGVRGAVIDTICEMLNRGVTPMVPSQGSVGASGDLAPLAHLALALIGEGECFDRERDARSRRRSDAERTNQAPGAGSQRSCFSDQWNAGDAGGGSPDLLAAEILADTADVIGALSLDALAGHRRSV